MQNRRSEDVGARQKRCTFHRSRSCCCSSCGCSVRQALAIGTLTPPDPDSQLAVEWSSHHLNRQPFAANSICTRTAFPRTLRQLAIRNRCPPANAPIPSVRVRMHLEHRLRESAKWTSRKGYAGSHRSPHRPSTMDIDGGAYSTLPANYHRSYHPHSKPHYLTGEDVG